MQHFKEVNLSEKFYELTDKYVQYYRSDVTYDLKKLSESSVHDRYFWMCRKSGTWFLKESRVFLKNSSGHNIFVYYDDCSSEVVKVYDVEILGNSNGVVSGNMFEFSYDEYVERVKNLALVAWKFKAQYEGGSMMLESHGHVSHMDLKFGRLIGCEEVPDDPLTFRNLLIGERDWRKHMYKYA